MNWHYAAKKTTRVTSYLCEKEHTWKEHAQEIYSITEVSGEYGIMQDDYNPADDSKEELVSLLRKIADSIEKHDVVDMGVIKDKSFWIPSK